MGGGNGKAHLRRLLEAWGRRGADSRPPFELHHPSLSLKTLLGCLESKHLSKRIPDKGRHPRLGVPKPVFFTLHAAHPRSYLILSCSPRQKEAIQD